MCSWFQYYNQSYTTIKEQKDFETSLFNKTQKGSGDVILLDNWTIVYRNNVDLLFYVVGSTDENEVNETNGCLVFLSQTNPFLVDVKLRVDMFIRLIEHDVAKKCGKTISLRKSGFGYADTRRNL